MNVLRKLTLKYLKLNRSRTFVTVFGIILSAALITVVAGVATSAKESLVHAQIMNSGNYDFYLSGEFTEQDFQKVRNTDGVADAYTYYPVGLALIEEPKSQYRPYLQLLHADQTLLDDFQCTLEEGRFAVRDDEVVLSKEFLQNTRKSYRVGDSMTLSFGERHFTEEYLQQSGLTDMVVPDMVPVFPEVEEFVPTGTKTYTIVGIMEKENSLLSNHGSTLNLYTCQPGDISQVMLVRLTDQAEPQFRRVIAEVTGVDESLLEDFRAFDLDSDAVREIEKQLKQSEMKITYFSLNDMLLIVKGYMSTAAGESYDVIFLAAAVMILVVVLASVFIIRNSFAISITEKTKLYGMLSSVGAAPGQIRNNVLFEAMILGIIGIPLGIGLGIGVTFLLMTLCNIILRDILGNVTLITSIPFYAVLLAIGVGAVTIFLSALMPALRASRIPPMEAIRSTRDINVRKNGEKFYRAPAVIRKLFGAGGVIAWKNMKRSRKQYRTTVISLIVSVSVFLTVFAFVDCSSRYLERTSFYRRAAYNMHSYLSTADQDGNSYSIAELDRKYNKIAHMDDIEKYRYYVSAGTFSFEVKEEALDEDYLKYDGPYSSGPGEYTLSFEIYGVDDDSFRELCRLTGKDEASCRQKGFITNRTKAYPPDEKSRIVSILNQPEGMVMKGYTEVYDNFLPPSPDETDTDQPEIDYLSEPDKVYAGAIEIAGAIPEQFMLQPYSSEMIVMTMERLAEILPENTDAYYLSGGMTMNVENAAETEEKLTLLSSEETDGIEFVGIQNFDREVNNLRALILVVQIFVYGFIIVITLIGVTNIFNTITTNMRLRRKEFAMLQSIGTTKKEFNRMIRLESLLYTFKSLMIGLPIGIAGGILVHYFFNQRLDESQHLSYSFPWIAVLISIFAVLFLLWIIMRFSLSKVRKQNIIETIRNDNI